MDGGTIINIVHGTKLQLSFHSPEESTGGGSQDGY